jgi:multiple sugar transport system ATP-binding protein
VVYGARPEHLALAAEGGMPIQVAVVEPTGADTLVSCRRGAAEVLAVFRERHAFAPGSTIRVVPDLQHAHLFDAATGKRLSA